MIDKELILVTVERIKKTLNRRFEKDADFYISNQDIQEIKNLLYLLNFETIAAWLKMKRYSAEILTKVILTNAWLIQPLPYNKIKVLTGIIKQCNPTILPEIMEEVIKNQIDVPLDLKRKLEPLYYQAVPIEICQQILEKGHSNIKVLKICVKRVLTLFPSSDELYQKSKLYFNQYPDLSIKIGKIDVRHLNTSEQNAFLELILNREILHNTDPILIWINTINLFKEKAFDLSVRYLNTMSYNDRLNSKKLINLIVFRLINADINNSYYINQVIELYSAKPKLRFSLILGLKKIRALDTAQKILDRYKLTGIPEHPIIKDVIYEIETGYKNKLSINNISDILFEIENKPSQHIKYVSKIFLKNPNFNQLFKELFSANRINIPIIQIFIIEVIISSGNRLIGTVLEYWNNQKNGSIKEKLLKLFSKDEFRTSETKQFIYENDFNMYQKIYGKGV
ncbi:MAG: hypothetical protein HQK65_04905 [Desulfamplus sp.]|nr:hypothetical protein [Desulfamplus sp.]